MSLGLVWAQSTAGVIGRRGGLPWHLPEDLAHFRAVTDGHPVIMGRRTWESLPDRVRPLPGRRNLVLTRNPGYGAAGAEVTGSLEEAVQRAGSGRAWVIGGGRLFAAARDLADLAEVTEVDIEVAGDTFAPPLTGWRRGASSEWRTSSTGLRYRFLRYLRVEG